MGGVSGPFDNVESTLFSIYGPVRAARVVRFLTRMSTRFHKSCISLCGIPLVPSSFYTRPIWRITDQGSSSISSSSSPTFRFQSRNPTLYFFRRPSCSSRLFSSSPSPVVRDFLIVFECLVFELELFTSQLSHSYQQPPSLSPWKQWPER